MNKIKVLLIDDEEDFRATMGARIKKWGFDFAEASSGEEGLAAVENEHPDIIVLDYKMPEMDGIVTLREIRKKDKDTPVIIFTAYPDEVAASILGDLDITAFIPKLSVQSGTQSSLKAAIENAAKKLTKNET